MEWVSKLLGVWHYLAAIVTVTMAAAASGHAIIYKRDSRAAVLWVGFIWLAPFFGPFCYLLFGVNRIRRRAIALRRGGSGGGSAPYPTQAPLLPPAFEDKLPPAGRHLAMLGQLVNEVVAQPLIEGNHVEPLINGDEAFPAMLDSIDRSNRSLTLSTYIFDRGHAGAAFCAALGRAVARGVQVRVLIDDTGARYSWPSMISALRRAKVPFARFLPSFAPLRLMSINLRNHRKILVGDGEVGFLGGMNIRDGHLLQRNPKRGIQDIHFRVRGPVVAQMQSIFAEDWLFTTGESLKGEDWFPPLAPQGQVLARGISDGPDEDADKLRWTLLGALSCARNSVQIVTPYFLPDQSLIAALDVASMRGVQVDIILPEKNNLPFVNWATCAILWQMLKHGCRVWLTRPPFDHSKLMLVDRHWSLIGSANWDMRSLRLNFEMDVECYDPDLAERLGRIVQQKLQSARQLTLREMDGRPLPIRLRDGAARLFSPLL